MPAYLNVDYGVKSLVEKNYLISYLFVGSSSADPTTATLKWAPPPKNAPTPPLDPDEPKKKPKKTKKEKRQEKRDDRKNRKFLDNDDEDEEDFDYVWVW